MIEKQTIIERLDIIINLLEKGNLHAAYPMWIVNGHRRVIEDAIATPPGKKWSYTIPSDPDGLPEYGYGELVDDTGGQNMVFVLTQEIQYNRGDGQTKMSYRCMNPMNVCSTIEIAKDRAQKRALQELEWTEFDGVYTGRYATMKREYRWMIHPYIVDDEYMMMA